MAPPGKRNGPPAQRPAPKDTSLDASTSKDAPRGHTRQPRRSEASGGTCLCGRRHRGMQLVDLGGTSGKPRPLVIISR